MALKKKKPYVSPTIQIVQMDTYSNLMTVSSPGGTGEDMPWGRNTKSNLDWDLNFYDYED